MNRDDFVKNSVEQHGVKKSLLIERLEYIGSYFSSLRNQLLESGFTVEQVWFGGRTQKDEVFHYLKSEIKFERLENHIKVIFDNSDYDTLVVDGENLKSKKYDLELSEELLDKYLSLFGI